MFRFRTFWIRNRIQASIIHFKNPDPISLVEYKVSQFSGVINVSAKRITWEFQTNVSKSCARPSADPLNAKIMELVFRIRPNRWLWDPSVFVRYSSNFEIVSIFSRYSYLSVPIECTYWVNYSTTHYRGCTLVVRLFSGCYSSDKYRTCPRKGQLLFFGLKTPTFDVKLRPDILRQHFGRNRTTTVHLL